MSKPVMIGAQVRPKNASGFPVIRGRRTVSYDAIRQAAKRCLDKRGANDPMSGFELAFARRTK